jgi:DNA mismatch endonuclease (patch repair protein)
MDTFTPKKRSWIMAQVKSQANRSTEGRLIARLRQHHVTGWRRHYPLNGKPDLTFPKERLAVFVDGCFWHGHPVKCRMPKTHRSYWRRKIARNIARDRFVTHALEKKGWKVIRIWEDHVSNGVTITRLRKALA